MTLTADDAPAYVKTLAIMDDVGDLVANEIRQGGKLAVETMLQVAADLQNTLGKEVTTAFYSLLDKIQAVVLGELSRA